jgi:two-component system sensor histidine kinase VicK
MAEGDFSPISVDSRDEISSLCEVLNRMGEQIQSDYDQFEREEARRREFVANVSHELKTPLTVIKSYSQTLGSAQVDPDTQREFLQIIDNEADRMSDTVSQLLELSSLSRERLEEATDIDLKLLCEEIVKSLDSKGLTVTISGNGSITRDKKRVRTILANIIENAIKYTEKGTVSINIHDNILTVKDSGIGMTEEECAHIFERFYRADKARGRGGTGLGLAIAKESAELMGADISVQSVPTEFTEFTIEF